MKRLFVLAAVYLVPVAVTLWGFEYWLWQQDADRLVQTADRYGVDFDSRSASAVAADLRAQGKKALIYVPPSRHLSDESAPSANERPGDEGAGDEGQGDADIFPLGALSKANNVVCNESGAWFSYFADRFGFNNPDTAWDRSQTDIVVLGDSFMLGNCVPNGSAMIDRLRVEYPGLLNLGSAGNGPLLTLATWREYGRARRPGRVIWAYYPNDLVNLERERRSPRLNRYLAERDYQQGLMTVQPAIDAKLEALAKQAESKLSLRDNRWLRMVRLQRLRGALKQNLASATTDPSLIADYATILQAVSEDVKAWDGELVFVYLPAAASFAAPESLLAKKAEAARQSILDAARAVGATVIDMQLAFAGHLARHPVGHPAPGSLSYTPSSHYNEAGNALAAQTLIGALKDD